MPDSLWDLSLRDALAATASAEPTPGGGSLAPATGAFGLALVVMALEVTSKRGETAALARAIASGKALLQRIAEHVDRDVLAYQKYVDARTLPKHDAQQRALRSTAMQAALLQATDAPLSAAGACLEALEYAASIAALVEGNVISDVVAGADILLGSLKAVLRSAAVNLPAIRDHATRQSLAARARDTLASARAVYESIQARDAGA